MKTTRLYDSDLKISRLGLQNGSRLADERTVLLLVRGSELHKRIPIGMAIRPVAFNQDVKALKAHDDLLPEFLFYWLLGNEDMLLGKVEHTGIGAGKLDTEVMKRLPVLLPPLSDQRSIVHILGTLDDKIELNRRMNETLEAMARALFKSWFVDFNPVRAKVEGRDTGLPREIADMFPDSFEDSELGEVPKGWRVVTVAEFALLNSEVWSKGTRPSAIEYVDLSNTKWGRIEAVTAFNQQEAPSRAQRVLRKNDSIIGTVRPGNGSYALVSEDGLTGSTGFAVLRPRKPEYAEIVYLSSTSVENIERLSHLADGGAYPAVRPEVVAATKIVRPNEAVVATFSRCVGSMLSKVAGNERESRTLVALRDTLLPKLLSGEILAENRYVTE